jgi:hypothetical protein
VWAKNEDELLNKIDKVRIEGKEPDRWGYDVRDLATTDSPDLYYVWLEFDEEQWDHGLRLQIEPAKSIQFKPQDMFRLPFVVLVDDQGYWWHWEVGRW